MYIYNDKTRQYELVFKSIDKPIVKAERIETDWLEDFSTVPYPVATDIWLATLARQQCKTIDNARMVLNNLGRFRIINTETDAVRDEVSSADILDHLDC